MVEFFFVALFFALAILLPQYGLRHLYKCELEEDTVLCKMKVRGYAV